MSNKIVLFCQYSHVYSVSIKPDQPKENWKRKNLAFNGRQFYETYFPGTNLLLAYWDSSSVKQG